MIQLGAMPLRNFVRLHPEAKVTPEELATLKAYLAPWTSAQNAPGNVSASSGAKTNGAQSTVPAASPAPVSLAMVQPEPNGFPFDPTLAPAHLPGH